LLIAITCSALRNTVPPYGVLPNPAHTACEDVDLADRRNLVAYIFGDLELVGDGFDAITGLRT